MSLNTVLGREAVSLCEPLCLLDILFLFYFCMIFNFSLLFPSCPSLQQLQGQQPLLYLIFSMEAAMFLQGCFFWCCLSWAPSPVTGALNYKVLDICLVSWNLLLDSSGVILPMFHLHLFLPSLIFYWSHKSPSLYFQHLLQWNLVFISLFTGNLKVMEFSVY